MSSPAPEQQSSGGKRQVTQVESLAVLVGAHPDALDKIYRAARPTDPAELGESPRGRLLTLERGAGLFLVTRPIVQALASDVLPWRGKVFDHGGNSGQNVVLGKKVLRFRAEIAPSAIDGRPTLVLDYAAHPNPWPVRALRDELRTVGSGIAIGPALAAGSSRPLFWFGLEIAR
jgi:hypothetical protein